MAIKVDQLTKTYGKQLALDNVSFETQKNSIVGFLGPNGAGKSTTMKILAGLIPASAGTCHISDSNIAEQSLAAKRKLGFLPENNPLYTDMYVREILQYEASTHRIKNKSERIDLVVKQTGLEDAQHKKISELSKGYRQRVGLALCIIHDPEVLLLDEPTSGLDPNQILEIRALIKELGKEKTVLLSTHLMQEVEALCDEVIILHQGKIRDHFFVNDLPNKYPNQSLEEIFVRLTK
ncbi:ATP-binding cassette domain-containing protein [Sphingobacterium bambusae]|uniref:ATP-binding cassette domain-containing protein n=1 Tax=Sphingobacterium bambusae TaxID=662858 RepID=A0ABW6BJP1_9SPHI|nr:ATP-binding cassette domain-containing protein [Sphingobacterium bambusae]WPL47663.1 ATP-binding cassette domain-containing protein [Sphingobacterium bambusae]